jgi:hypothetical protein
MQAFVGRSGPLRPRLIAALVYSLAGCHAVMPLDQPRAESDQRVISVMDGGAPSPDEGADLGAIPLPDTALLPPDSGPDVASKTQNALPLQCGVEGSTKSYSDMHPIQVRITNGLANQVISLFWLDYEGVRRSYGIITPGQTRVLLTYATHPWVLADKKDNCLGLFVIQHPVQYPPPVAKIILEPV